MWNDVLQKLEQLKVLDKHFQVFGAEDHRYILHPPVPDLVIEKAEDKLGVQLPEALRVFYHEVGDGVAGPFYGLKQILQLDRVFEPDKLYPGIDSIKESAKKEGRMNEDGFFMAASGSLVGLMPIIHEGCGHHFCLVTMGPKTGQVVYVSADGFVYEEEKALLELYEIWLDRELENFEVVKGLMLDGRTLKEITDEMKAQFGAYNAADHIVSIADVDKPAWLFGSSGRKIYYGAMQTPWFEEVLQSWQKNNNIKVVSPKDPQALHPSASNTPVRITDEIQREQKLPWYKRLFQKNSK